MKNLISKNPVLRFLSGKKFNMSRLIRRSDGKYLDKNGNIVTGNDGNLLGDAWKYLAGKYGVNYANRVSWNTRNKNIYLNGKWRADYTPSGNVTVDWNTATNKGKASKYFTDSKTGKKTYFNASDKPISKLNTPKKNVAKGNDGQQKNSNSNKLSDNLLNTPSTFFKVRHSPLANIITGGIPGGYLILNTIDNPSILKDFEKIIIAPSLPGGYFLDEYITNPDFREPVNRFSLNAGKWLLGLKKGGNILKYLTGNNWLWADAVPLNRKGGNIQKHQKGSNLLYTWGKTEGSKGLDAVGVQKNWRKSDRFNRFMLGLSDMLGLNDIYDYLVEANGGNHFGNTQELQKFINSKLSELSKTNNKNYGSIVVDNKFGNQTEEGARLVYELLKNGPTQNAYMAPTSLVISNKYSNPGMLFNKAATRGFLNSINARYTDDLISGIMNMKEDDLTRLLIYSRAGITSDMDENAIRDRLGNTFALLGIHGHLGGNDKRRFRNWFNTKETPQSVAHILTPESVVRILTPTRNLFSTLDNWNKNIKKNRPYLSFLKKGGLIKV